MTSEEIVVKVQSVLADDLLKAEVTLGDAVIHVAPDSLRKVATLLKDNPDLNFDYLSDITGVDYLDLEREPRFEAVYAFNSIDKNHSIRIRVGLPEENPEVPSLSDLWKGAAFPERELFDMFGINVTGHPNLKRLIMPEGWEGHPLRRDYSLTTEEVTFSHNRDYKGELVQSKPKTR